MQTEKKYWTTVEVANELGISGQTIRRWLKANKIACSHTTIGGQARFSSDDVARIRAVLSGTSGTNGTQ